MPISTSAIKTLILEKKITRIDINDEVSRIDYQVRYRTKLEDGTILNDELFTIQVEGTDMLELAGVNPRLEVPSGKNYYDAVKDRSYEFFDLKGLWPK